MFNFSNFKLRNYLSPGPQVDAPFTGMPIFGPDRSGVPDISVPENDEFSMLDRIYNAPSPALEQYKRHIASMPSREQYQPGKMGRVGAALVGAAEGLNRGAGAGYMASRSMVEEPYMRAMDEYKNRGASLGALADIEQNDVKSKLSMAKQVSDTKREDQKAAAQILRWAAQNKLNDAQATKALADAGIVGKSIQTNKDTGELEIVNINDGSRKSVGKFDRSAKEKDAAEVRVHGQKGAIDLEQDKNLFGWKLPQQAQSDIEVHRANRQADSEMPIVNGGFDFTAPSQDNIAYQSAIGKVTVANPGYMKFVDENPRTRAKAAEDDPTGHADFLSLVDAEYKRSLTASQRKPITRPPSVPTVELPGASPLNPPANDIRAQAIAELTRRGKVVNEATIKQAIELLGGSR
jgi:hypothetical protein